MDADGRISVQTLIRRARGGLPVALVRRFSDANLLSQSAALAFYALLSLAPLLLILLWITASALPSARESLMEQIGSLVGDDTAAVAQVIISNAEARPDTGSIAGVWSLVLLFLGATAVFGQLQDVLTGFSAPMPSGCLVFRPGYASGSFPSASSLRSASYWSFR